MTQPREDNPQQKAKTPSPRRRRLAAVLHVALLVSGIVLAWQVHTVYIAPREPARVDPRPPQPRRERPPRAGALQPSDLRRPEARLGMKYLAKDPGEVPPPTGAAYAFGYEWPGMDGQCRQLWFHYAGGDQAVVDHYRRILKDRRLDLVSDRRAPARGGKTVRRLVFHASSDPVGSQVVVGLRPHQDGRKLVLSVTTIRRTPRPAGQERTDE